MGTRRNEKGRRFEFLIQQIDKSLEEKFYVEGMAITYALFEERTYRLLDRLEVNYRGRDKLYNCLNKLKTAIERKTINVTTKKDSLEDFIVFLEEKLIDSNLVDDILIWRGERNRVVHDLAKTNIDYSSLESVCENGKNLFRRYTAIIMEIKKRLVIEE